MVGDPPSRQTGRHRLAFSSSSVGMSSSIRTPTGSASGSPTDGVGLSRRLSWNSSQGEAISMRDLAGSVLISAAGPSTGAGLSRNSSFHDGGTDTPLTADELDLGVPDVLPPFRHSLPPPLSPIVTEAGSNDFGSRGLGFSPSAPHLFNSIGSSQGFAASLHDEGNDLERLTPDAPDHNQHAHATGVRSSPNSKRVYNHEGLARSSALGLGKIARSPTVRRVSNTLRIASERVVNIMGNDKASPAMGGYENLSRTTSDSDTSPTSDPPSHQHFPPFPETSSLSPLAPAASNGTMFAAPLPNNGGRLRGRTFGLFSARNPLRRAFDRILRFSWTEPIILALILFNAIVLTIQSAPPLFSPRPNSGYFHSWEDYALFVLFIIFTVEMFARMVVTGFFIDPETSTRDWYAKTWSFFMRRAKAEDDPTQAPAPDSWQKQQRRKSSVAPIPGRLKRNLTTVVGTEAPFQEAVARQQEVLGQNRPYLRHSWHRIDLLAIVMFWVMFILALTRNEATDAQHLYIFRALSVLRATRLLVITSGTATILHSLKRAGPLILNVSVFIVFAAALFSIIGVQSFRGSLRRTCVLIDLGDPANNTYLNNTCGGWVHPETLKSMNFFKENGELTTIPPKGFICPIGQECHTVSYSQESDSESFDNIFLSLVQVLIIAGVNTWTGTMYNIMSAEFFSSSLFFIVAIIVLNFWLMNLLVAVVVNTFKDIRSETKKSAFGADDVMLHQPEWAAGAKKPKEESWLLKWYKKTQIVWPLLVVVDLMAQAFKQAESSDRQLRLLRNMEIGFSILWDVEILIRIVAYLPDWQAFLRSGRNDFDLFLAVGCSIIQIPPIRNSTVYPWLTVFQVLRWYRFVIVFPRMRPLLINVFGSFAGMLNMVLFLFLMNFLSALMALQFLRGDMENDSMINFSQTYNAFLGMYQIFSTENWTTVLYGAMSVEWGWDQGWIVCIFLMIWFLFANFILMQMFIAVINENFEMAEELKRTKQIEAFVRHTEPKSIHATWIDRLNPYRLIKARHKAVKVTELPPNLILPLKQSIGADVGAPHVEDHKGAKAAIRRLFGLDNMIEAFPMRNITKHNIPLLSSSAVDVHQDFDDDYDDDRGLTDLLPPINGANSVDEHMDAMRERRNQQADFISAHPSFDKSLWIFSQSNPIRQLCQTIVPPAYGERIYGRPANHLLSVAFRIVLFLAVIASIVVFAIATPHYRKDYYAKHGDIRATWFDMTELALGCMFIIEAAIKIIADGFIFAPNAYLLSLWNLVDFVILITIIINTICSFVVVGGVSRATRALKAFRALRLITLFSRLRDTFHVVFFAGALRIVDASILMILYLIPFAVWGLNIFSGRLPSCIDGNVANRTECVSEFVSTPVGDIGFMAPRVWANPRFGGSIWSFDSFRESMLILFEIVSLEGWTDVMSSVMDIVGFNLQPSTNNEQWNSLFFLIFNLFGGIIILTVFLSIIIENFSIRSGSALLTNEQNQWIDLAKFIRQQAPSQLPRRRPKFGFRAWCYDRAVQKRGYWTRGFTFLYFVHIILLMMEDYSNSIMTETQLDLVFLIFTVLYAIDLVVRFFGLGFHSFRSNGWNLFDVVVVTGSFVTTIPALQASMHNVDGNQASKQVQKLFLVSVALKLVQRLDSLNQLFKTAIASLPAIGNLFLLWAVVFLFMAVVMMEIFGLTKMGNNAVSVFQNYHSFGNTLVMLAFMSTGEGWNGYMHDYTVEYPRCTYNNNWLHSDCGSVGWAYVLFIFWNILSMYIFLNMFTGVVVQSFAYVYQSPGGASLTREQIRSFKRVWAAIDTDRTGYIKRKDFTRFFSELNGVFEVRLYPVEFSVPNLLGNTVPDPDTPPMLIETGKHYAVDVRKLRHQIAQIDYTKVRERRRQYVRLFNEAKVSEEKGRGISFTSMLMMLAHYKLIDDEKALQVDELLLRRAKMERVEDLVNLDRVRGLLRTIYWRRKFIRSRVESRILAQQGDGIPAIVLDPIPQPEDDEGVDPLHAISIGTKYHTPAESTTNIGSGATPRHSTTDLNSYQHAPRTPPPRRGSSGDDTLGQSPENLSVSASSSRTMFAHGNTSNATYMTALSRGSDIERRASLESTASRASRASSELTYRPDASMYEDEGEEELMNAMASSAWADMMQEAVYEEGDDTD